MRTSKFRISLPNLLLALSLCAPLVARPDTAPAQDAVPTQQSTLAETAKWIADNIHQIGVLKIRGIVRKKGDDGSIPAKTGGIFLQKMRAEIFFDGCNFTYLRASRVSGEGRSVARNFGDKTETVKCDSSYDKCGKLEITTGNLTDLSDQAGARIDGDVVTISGQKTIATSTIDISNLPDATMESLIAGDRAAFAKLLPKNYKPAAATYSSSLDFAASLEDATLDHFREAFFHAGKLCRAEKR